MTRHVLVPLAALLAPGCFVVSPVDLVRESDHLVFDEPMDAIVFDLDAGALVVRPTDGDAVEVERSLQYHGQAPDLRAEVVDGVLYLDVECDSAPWGCAVDHEIAVPTAVAVSGFTGSGGVSITGARESIDVTTGSGGIYLCNVEAPVYAETGSGGVTLRAVHGDVEIVTGSGAIEGEHLWLGEAILETGSGGVDVQLDEAPIDLWLHTGSGAVSLEVPSGDYALDLHTGSGSVSTSGVDDVRGANARVAVDTGSGSIEVVGRP